MAGETSAQYAEICARVQAVADDFRRTRLHTGLGRLVAAALGPLLLALLVDSLFPLPGVVRALFVALWAFGIVWLLVREIGLPWRRRLDVEHCAEFIESRIPPLRTSLITAIQVYGDLERERPWFDRQMVEATVRHALSQAGRFNFGTVVDKGPLRKSAGLAGLAVLITLLVAVMDPHGLLSHLGRFLGAFTEVQRDLTAARSREIRVAVLPDGKTTVLRGAAVTLEATLVGFASDHLALHVQPEEGEAEEYRLETAGLSTIQHTLGPVEKTFQAFFTCADVSSERVAIRVVERPSVVNIQLECIYPTYVRRPPLRLPRSSGEITALKGSHVVLTIEGNKALQTGWLQLLQGRTIPLAVGGRFARGVVSVEEEITYQVRLTCADGFENEEARDRTIKVVHDQPPEIQFVSLEIQPEQEVQLTETAAVGKTLNVAAKDDYGIRKVIFHYDIEAVVKELYHEPVRNKQKQRTFAIPQQTWTGTIARVGETGVKVGDRLSFWGETQDGFDRGEGGQPQSARTPVFHIVLIGEEFAWQDVSYQPDANFDFGLYDTLKRKDRGRQRPPRESIDREAKPEMPGIYLDLPYGNDEVPVQYQSAWKAYTSSLIE
jgi:hypothetical protein